MTTPAPLNRRQWLKAAGTTLAGLALVPHLSAAGPAGDDRAHRDDDRTRSATAVARREDRRYIHGFEAYPGR